MSRTMLIGAVRDTDFDDEPMRLFDVRRVTAEPAAIAYLRPRATEYVSGRMLTAAARVVAVSVSDGGFVPEFED